jgi:tyrosine-protein kinase Etk/Wzc
VLKKDVEAGMKARGDLLGLEVDIAGEEAKLKASQDELARLPKVDTLNRSIQDNPALSELARTNGLPPGALIGLSMKDEETNLAYREMQKQAAESQTKLASLQRQQQELLGTRKLGAAVLPQVAALHERELEEARLAGEYEISRKVYEETKLRYQQASLDIASRNSTIQVLDKAIPPENPSGPHKLRAAALGALVGLMLGMAFSLVRDAIMSGSHPPSSRLTPAAR